MKGGRAPDRRAVVNIWKAYHPGEPPANQLIRDGCFAARMYEYAIQQADMIERPAGVKSEWWAMALTQDAAAWYRLACSAVNVIKSRGAEKERKRCKMARRSRQLKAAKATKAH